MLRFSLSCTYNSAHSCCIEHRSNNPKSQPNLNFYILLSDKQRCRRWLHAIGRAQQHLRFCTKKLFTELATELFIKKFLFQWSPHFSAFESASQQKSPPPKQVHIISTAHHPLPSTETTPADT